MRLRARQWTVRARLTALYGAVFLASGAVLLAITYALVRERLPGVRFFVARAGVVTAGASPNQVFGSGPVVTAPTPPQLPLIAEHVVATFRLQRADSLHQLLVESVVALAIMVLASTVLGWFVAGRALRPVRAMTSATHRISEHNLHERLPAAAPHDEIGELATTFNALLARLEAAFDSQRQFVANASHELRTPLTLQRAVLEVALADPHADTASLRAMGERVLVIGAQQETLIEALLTLARSQRGLDRHEAFDLAAIAQDAIDALGPQAEQGSIAIEAELGAAAAEGDPLLVERLVSNLLVNAVRHNHRGGIVHVATTTTATSALVRVTNTGPVVPPGETGRVLQPFQRLDAGRGSPGDGLGLGLAIVAAIADAHAATLCVQAGTSGGLDIMVAFPQPSARDGAAPRPPSLATRT